MTEHTLDPYEAPWRNRNHQLYEQYCYEDELPDKLRQIIKIHGKAFDDYWQIFKAAHRKPQRQVIVRRPLWMTVSTTERFTDKAKYNLSKREQKWRQIVFALEKEKGTRVHTNSRDNK